MKGYHIFQGNPVPKVTWHKQIGNSETAIVNGNIITKVSLEDEKERERERERERKKMKNREIHETEINKLFNSCGNWK